MAPLAIVVIGGLALLAVFSRKKTASVVPFDTHASPPVVQATRALLASPTVTSDELVTASALASVNGLPKTSIALRARAHHVARRGN
jgi:hypothetical protein